MGTKDRPFVKKLAGYIDLSDEELSIIDRFFEHTRPFPAGSDLIHEGQRSPGAFILDDGWVSSYKVLRGGGRQIVNILIPGDFLGLRTVLYRTADHSIEPITQISASTLDKQNLLHALETGPRLATAILWAASADEAMVVERLVSLGRRDAVERTAHFMLELWARLRRVGMADPLSFACPLSQYHLADALGLSAVHINRVLRQLREDGLLTFRKGIVTFDDFEHLVRIADFNIGYLDYDSIRVH